MPNDERVPFLRFSWVETTTATLPATNNNALSSFSAAHPPRYTCADVFHAAGVAGGSASHRQSNQKQSVCARVCALCVTTVARNSFHLVVVFLSGCLPFPSPPNYFSSFLPSDEAVASRIKCKKQARRCHARTTKEKGGGKEIDASKRFLHYIRL